MKGISWNDRVGNEEVVGRAGEKRKILGIIKGRKRNRSGHCMQQTQVAVMVETMEGLVNGKWNREREKDQMMDDLRYRIKKLSD